MNFVLKCWFKNVICCMCWTLWNALNIRIFINLAQYANLRISLKMNTKMVPKLCQEAWNSRPDANQKSENGDRDWEIEAGGPPKSYIPPAASQPQTSKQLPFTTKSMLCEAFRSSRPPELLKHHFSLANGCHFGEGVEHEMLIDLEALDPFRSS